MPFETRRERPSQPPRPAPAAKLSPHRVRQRVWTAGRLLLLAGLLVGIFGLFFLTAMRVVTRAREVRVPDVTGQSLTDAEAAFAREGLSLRIDAQRQADPKVPADHVLSVDPKPGTVLRRDRSVRIRVSAGQQDPVVPNITGQPERAAQIALAQEHIQVTGTSEIHTSDFPADTVVAQTPPAKSRSSTALLLVNRGDLGTRYVMPDLIGTPATLVQVILRRQGFRIPTPAVVPYPGLPPGIVVRQTPQPGFQIGFGEVISLEVSQ